MDVTRALPKVLLSASAVGLVVLHSSSVVKLDTIALGLLAFGALPWIASFLRSAELPGGVKVQFQEIRAEQARQARELDAIKFLVANFLTASEQDHLQRIAAAPAPFMVKADYTSAFFAAELRKLRALGFIKQLGDDGVRALLRDDGKARNVCDYFGVTERGREFLQLQTQVAALGGEDRR